MDARDTARRWLAEEMYRAWHGRSNLPFEDRAQDIQREYLDVADAILNAPGVTVSALVGPAEHWGPGSLCIGPDLETRIAIQLPAQPIGDGDA